MQVVNIALEAFGIIISGLLLMYSVQEIRRHPHGDANREQILFTAMLATNMLVLVCDEITWIFQDREEYTVLLYACNFLVYALGYVIEALFSAYLQYHVAQKKHVNHHAIFLISIACGAAILLVVISMFNKMYFSFDGGDYVRGPMYWLSQAYPAVIIVINTVLILQNRKKLGRTDTISLLSYCVLPLAALLIQMKVYGITLLYMATTLSMLIIHISIQAEQGRQLQKKQMELTQANISIMLSQIQPHFLYNALGTICELCHSNPEEAERATIEFADFLRGNMDSLKAELPIPFSQELAHTNHYLALEQLRFPDSLQIAYDIQTTDFHLPTLTLQPIVENAVRYGATKREDRGGIVSISTRETDVSYVVTVVDNGAGFHPTQKKEDGRTHIGISNVEIRLKTMCSGTLEIQGVRDVGTTVIITLPKEE